MGIDTEQSGSGTRSVPPNGDGLAIRPGMTSKEAVAAGICKPSWTAVIRCRFTLSTFRTVTLIAETFGVGGVETVHLVDTADPLLW